MGYNIKNNFSTYFEILVGDAWKRYRTNKVLAGRHDILQFCQANQMPVECVNQIVAYQIKETRLLKEMAAVEI